MSQLTQKDFLDSAGNFDYAKYLDTPVELLADPSEAPTAPVTEAKIENTPISTESQLAMQNHHFARLAMMKAEARGEFLSYDDALNL